MRSVNWTLNCFAMTKPSLYLLLASLFTASGSIKTYSDFDETLDFSRYQNFALYNDMDTGLSDLDEKRFSAALVSVLEEKDFQSSEDPDFMINFYSKVYEENNRNHIGIGIGGGGSHVGGGISGGIPINMRKHIMSLTVEFVDATTNQLFWQGVAEAKFNPD